MQMVSENTSERDNVDESMEYGISPRTLCNLLDGINSAEAGGFYRVSNVILNLNNHTHEGTSNDMIEAKTAYQEFLEFTNHMRHVEREELTQKNITTTTDRLYGQPILDYFMLDYPPSQRYRSEMWPSLFPHRQLCLHIINKFTLTDEQALTFLIFADHYGLQNCTKPPINTDPIRMIISGPGGTGKSQIFQAIRCFFVNLDHANRLKVTAPTGLAANNVKGSTVHSEARLRVSSKSLESTTKCKYSTARTNLEERYNNVNTQIVDEIYFLGAQDYAKLSQNLGLATCRTNSDQPYGNLNMIFAGDPAQLPPPKAMSLFDRRLVKHAESNLNAQNDNAKQGLNGVILWRDISDCIVLSKIMRQSDPCFQRILNRLRFGNCTEDDYDILQTYVIGNRTDEENNNLLNISHWLQSSSSASPLIMYTNVLRDMHNTRCTQTFASYTNQEYNVYHSIDTVDCGRVVLTNQAAQAAWNTPVKQGEDLSGKLALIPMMPIFITSNIATELGLSNGASGTLVSVKYMMKDGLRFAISVDVDVTGYTHGSKDNPHRVTLVPIIKTVTYKLPGNPKLYTARRSQIPIIPAFAFTAHNSQSRSLERACIDLESCPTTAAAYVMLSRLKSMDGLSILRPFSYCRISSHCPEETRQEIKRLEHLSDTTKERCKLTLKWYYDIQKENL